jgi:hypothetical protein
MMQDAGLDRCDYRNLSAGIVAIHSGFRHSGVTRRDSRRAEPPR